MVFWQPRDTVAATSTVDEPAMNPAESSKLAARHNLVEIAEACRKGSRRLHSGSSTSSPAVDVFHQFISHNTVKDPRRDSKRCYLWTALLGRRGFRSRNCEPCRGNETAGRSDSASSKGSPASAYDGDK